MSVLAGATAASDAAQTHTHRTAVTVLLCVDLALIAAHGVSLALPGLLPDARWNIEFDGGFGESFQYIKWALLALAFAGVAWRERAVGYLAWAMLFAYLWLDDRLQLHERGGVFFARRIDFSGVPLLRPQDVGELLSVALVGAALMLPLAAFWYWGRAAARRVGEDMGALMLALVVFGVGVDALHSALLTSPALAHWLGTLEDGGEMVVASLMLAYAIALWHRAPRPAYAERLRRRFIARG